METLLSAHLGLLKGEGEGVLQVAFREVYINHHLSVKFTYSRWLMVFVLAVIAVLDDSSERRHGGRKERSIYKERSEG